MNRTQLEPHIRDIIEDVLKNDLELKIKMSTSPYRNGTSIEVILLYKGTVICSAEETTDNC